MNLYIVQPEEGSGIPGTPIVFADEAEAQDCYEELWREIHEGLARYDDGGHARTPDEIKAVVEAVMEGDYDEDWPEDGGVRMWQVEL